MATLLASRCLIDSVENGTTGSNDMSPACCVLSDGTYLVGIVTQVAGSPEQFVVYHLNTALTILGQWSYTKTDTSGRDGALVALPDKKALLVVTNNPFYGDVATAPYTESMVLDCSGNAPVPGAVNAVPIDFDFTGSMTNRFGFYESTTNQVVVHGKTHCALFGAGGGYLSSVSLSGSYGYAQEYARHPSNPLLFGVNYQYINPREYTIGTGTITATDHVEWKHTEQYWLLGAGSMYESPHGVLEGHRDASDNEEWQVYTDPGAVNVGYYPLPDQSGYVRKGLNYDGPMRAHATNAFMAVTELWYQTAPDGTGATNTNYIPVFSEMDLATTTFTQTLLPWLTAVESVSVNYGSFTMDVGGGVALVVGNSVSEDSPQRYSTTVWTLAVKANAPAIEPDRVERVYDETQRSSASGRLSLRQVSGVKIESVLNETPGQIRVNPGTPVPVRTIAIYPGDVTDSTGVSKFGQPSDPKLVQTWRGLPILPQLSVISDTLCTTNGVYLSANRDQPEEVDLGTQARFIAADYDPTAGRWDATLDSELPWSFTGTVDRIELQYRKVRELFSFTALSLDPGMALTSDFGTTDLMEMTISGVIMPRYPLGYTVFGAGDSADNWYLQANPQAVLATAYKKVTKSSQFNLAIPTPLYVTVVFKPPLVTAYLSYGPGKTTSFTVQDPAPTVIHADVSIGKRQGEAAIANFELLEVSVDTYARSKAQVEELNAAYSSIYGSA